MRRIRLQIHCKKSICKIAQSFLLNFPGAMTIAKERLSDIKEKYEKAVNLIENESKTDPETAPYKSHYEVNIFVLESYQNSISGKIIGSRYPERD